MRIQVICRIGIWIQDYVVAVGRSTHVVYEDSQCGVRAIDRHCSHFGIVTIDD
jgi:hypothetical protein